MSDNDREQRGAEQDKERRESRDERQDKERREDPEDERQGPRDERRTYHEERQLIDSTSPLWRLLGVVSFFGALAALGFYLETVGLGREFSTVATIAVVFSLGYWADRRPDRLERRAGPFWRIATAIRESREDIRQYTYARPLRVAITLSVIYGVAIVLVQSAVLALLQSIYSWHLAVFAGALIGAFVIAPSFFRDIWNRVAQGPADYADYHREHREEREGEEHEGYEDDAEDAGSEEYEEEENAR